MEALGLGYFDYNGAKTLLRMLANKGIAKEVDKISPKGKGRKMVVYEIPDEFTLSIKPPETMPCHPPKRKRKPKEEEETAETTHDEVGATPHEIAAVVAPSTESECEYEYVCDDD